MPILLKCHVKVQKFLITNRPSSMKQAVIQMLELWTERFLRNGVVPYLFIAFVFPLSNLVGTGMHKLERQLVTMQACFIEKSSIRLTNTSLSMIFQVHYKYMMQILALHLIWRNKGYCLALLLLAN